MSNVVCIYPRRVKIPATFNTPTGYLDWVAAQGKALAQEGLAARKVALDYGKTAQSTSIVLQHKLNVALVLMRQADDMIDYANRLLDDAYSSMGLQPPGKF